MTYLAQAKAILARATVDPPPARADAQTAATPLRLSEAANGRAAISPDRAPEEAALCPDCHTPLERGRKCWQ